MSNGGDAHIHKIPELKIGNNKNLTTGNLFDMNTQKKQKQKDY